MKPGTYTKTKPSEIEWIGEIPEHWQVNHLKNVCSIKYGSSLGEEDRIVGDFDVYGSNGPIGKHNVPLTASETIIIGRKGSIGALNYSEKPCFPIDTTYYLDTTLTNSHLKWLFYCLTCLKLKERNQDIAIPGLSRENVNSMKIPVPPKEEQKIISDFLDIKTKQIDSEVKRNQDLTRLLREKQQATINQAITKGLDPSVPTRDSEIEWIGHISKNWKVLKFRSVLEKKEKRNDDNSEREMLSVSQYFGIIKKEYESDTLRRSKEESQRYFIVEPNDLVVNVMWLHYRGLGVSQIEGIVSPDYGVYKINSKIIHPQFLDYLVRSDVYLNEYAKHLRGIRPNSSRISHHDFLRLPLLLPPHDEQKHISDFLKKEIANIQVLIEKIQLQNQQLMDYHQTLIWTLITGKLDVRKEAIIQ